MVAWSRKKNKEPQEVCPQSLKSYDFEAATQFNARAIAELYPSGGPVKTIVG